MQIFVCWAKLTEDIHYLRFGNQCRFILESHARSNYNIENVTNNVLDDIMRVYNVDIIYKARISRMLDIINSLSHGISYSWDEVSSISPREIQKAARTVLWMLYQKDSAHVLAMTEGVTGFSKAVNNWQ